MRALATVAGAVVLGFGASTGAAAGAPGPTPTGFTGACNMSAAWPGLGPGSGVGVQPGGGMENAMTVNTLHGNGSNGDNGMNIAVAATGASC